LQDISFVIGGQAGDGVMRTAELLGKAFNRLGLYSFVINDYGSLIRGGHNFCKVRAADRQVWLHRESVELIAAINQDTILKHKDKLTDGGRVLFDSDVAKYDGPKTPLPIPITTMVKQSGGIPIMKNSVIIGAISYLYGIPLDMVNEILTWAYGARADKNIELAKNGYSHAEKNFKQITKVEPKKRQPTPFVSGAETVALGAVKAGMKLYVTYPMTPSTAILNYVGPNQEELGILLVHPENEIGVANMMLGAAYTGVRTMAGTAGGGFALMEEAFSMAGQAEIPSVFVMGQRVAPAVGVPTYTSQGDLRFALHAGHGEFPRIVVAPGDPEEAFVNAGEAMNLAWKYQTPAIILVDKHLLESYMSIGIDEGKVKVEPAKVVEGSTGEYKRYRFTDSGVSPMAFPGRPGAIVKVTSYEHDEDGYAIETPDGIEKMQNKRLRKISLIEEDLKKRVTVKIHGDPNAENLVVAWGSTKGAILETMPLLKKPLKFMQVLYLSPFPEWEVSKHLEAAKNTVIVEGNLTGQLRSLIKERTGHQIKNSVLKNDGRPFDPVALAGKLKEVFGWT
jgi:2-oxoglutarate ferredoxin oxidoreductase subunit alpha